ncbi:MAG: hypothetical protein HRF49_06530 [bacterium]|jgi:hypothetical protein
MFLRNQGKEITVDEAVELFIREFDPPPGNLTAIRRAFTEFSVVNWNKRGKHWLRTSHHYLEKLLRLKWKIEGNGY